MFINENCKERSHERKRKWEKYFFLNELYYYVLGTLQRIAKSRHTNDSWLIWLFTAEGLRLSKEVKLREKCLCIRVCVCYCVYYDLCVSECMRVSACTSMRVCVFRGPLVIAISEWNVFLHDFWQKLGTLKASCHIIFCYAFFHLIPYWHFKFIYVCMLLSLITTLCQFNKFKFKSSLSDPRSDLVSISPITFYKQLVVHRSRKRKKDSQVEKLCIERWWFWPLDSKLSSCLCWVALH